MQPRLLCPSVLKPDVVNELRDTAVFAFEEADECPHILCAAQHDVAKDLRLHIIGPVGAYQSAHR